MFVPFVLLGVSDDLFTLSSGKIKAGKSVVTVTAETRGHWLSIYRCLSPKKKSVVLSVPLNPICIISHLIPSKLTFVTLDYDFFKNLECHFWVQRPQREVCLHVDFHQKRKEQTNHPLCSV